MHAPTRYTPNCDPGGKMPLGSVAMPSPGVERTSVGEAVSGGALGVGFSVAGGKFDDATAGAGSRSSTSGADSLGDSRVLEFKIGHLPTRLSDITRHMLGDVSFAFLQRARHRSGLF